MSDADARVLAGYIDRLSRWGTWGADDELGALNLVGPDQVAAAAALVRRGKVVPLSLPYDQRGPQPGGFRSNPQLIVTATGTDHLAGAQDPLPGDWGPAKGFGYADDLVILPSQSGTQWDALCHIFHEGRMWNGYTAGQHTSGGAARNGIQHWADRMIMRGVLVDLPRVRGVEALEPGHAISGEELDAALAAHEVSVRTGDALLVRTGHLAARREAWGDYAGGPAPGLSLHSAPWLAEHEVAAVATDTWGVEVRPNEIAHFQPLHTVALVHMGLALGEVFDLDALADDCAADGRYEFLFVAPPLPVTGAAGAPVAALAVK